MPTQPLIIKEWKNAVADSAHEGFGMMKLVDIESFPGAVKVQKKTVTMFHAALSTTFTADASTDVCTIGAAAPDTGTAVTVSSSGSLPSGLSASTNYFVIKVTATTYKLATTIANANAGTAIDITSAGTGTHTVTTVNPGTINHIIKDPRSGVYFLHDSNARVWYYNGSRALLLNGNTLTNGSGRGLVVFRTSDGNNSYLLVFRNAVLDIVNVTGTSQLQNPSWTSSWQTLNSLAGATNSHHAILAKDNIIYFCDDRYVGSIREVGVFDPADVTKYSYNNQALDFIQGEIAQCLEERGNDLLIAGNTYNSIYPWDRISSSYNLPIDVPEVSVKKIKNIGGILYILAGVKGNIYRTLGTTVQFFKKVPDYLVNNSSSLTANPVAWGGIGAVNGSLVFGLSGQTSGNNGVYRLYPDGRLLMDNMPSTGSASASAIFAENDFYFLGYAGGADSHDFSRYSSFEAVIQSELYRIADKTGKGSYSTLEVQIARPIAAAVRVGWRSGLSAAFTTLASFTTDSGNTSYKSDISLTDLENIQLQIELSGEVELIEIRLIP